MPRFGIQLACSSWLLLFAVALLGCNEDKQTARSRKGGQKSGAGLQRRSDRGEALLSTAIAQLRNLPSYVDVELTPPQVVLDSRSSSDGQDVLAMLMPLPNQQDRLQQEGMPLSNFMVVPAGNSRFRALGVRSGDIVKYYAVFDDSALATEKGHFRKSGQRKAGQGKSSETNANQDDAPDVSSTWNEGFVREAAVELAIAQVVDDNSLIMAQPSLVPIMEPKRIEVWRYSDDRMLEFRRRLGRYANRGIPKLAWEPTPDQRVLLQILDRVNPWSRQNHPQGDWQVEPMLETLPDELRANDAIQPYLSADVLTRSSFDMHDIRMVQQAIWLRDISEWARGEGFDNLQRAERLFDWTVRNIQLDGDGDFVPRWPWQTLLYGHGTAQQRAWIFALLCRQQQIDVVVLTASTEEGDSKFWLPAVLHEGELYLFDTSLGLPLPGINSNPNGQGIATLSQLTEQPQLLEPLNIGELTYSITGEQLSRVTANIVVDPSELTRRASLLESQLKGQDLLFLTALTADIAKTLSTSKGITKTQLWEQPFRTLLGQIDLGKREREFEAAAFQPFAWRPSLYKARVLHFQGRQEVVKDLKHGGIEEEISSHREAIQLYINRKVRPPKRVLDQLSSPEKRDIYTTAKIRASYWLGLLSFDQGRFKAAIDWLDKRTLQPNPSSPWTGSARYNLARAHEALGQVDEAIALYQASESPQRHGNLLRARQLDSNRDDAEETESQ